MHAGGDLVWNITVALGDHELRFVSVHLKSGCWGSEQDADASRTQTCTTLRNQILKLKARSVRRDDEGMAFGILGDFNRRLAVSGDWAPRTPG